MLVIPQHDQQATAVGDDVDPPFAAERYRLGVLGARLHPDILDPLFDRQRYKLSR